MATTAQNIPATSQPPVGASKAASAAPKKSAVFASQMNSSLAQTAAILDRPVQRAREQQQASQDLLGPEIAKLDERDASQRQQLAMYDQRMNTITLAMQRQRLITINRAQILKKVLPIVGIFSLIAGAKEGFSGAMAALGGGLAGLSQGMDQQYQRAWKNYDAEYNKMMQEAKDTQLEMKSVIEDNSKTAEEKIDLLKVYSGNNRLVQQALASKDNKLAAATNAWQKTYAMIDATESAHKTAQRASKPATQDEANFAGEYAYPFHAPQGGGGGLTTQAKQWAAKYAPSAQGDQDVEFAIQNAQSIPESSPNYNSAGNVAARAIASVKAPTEVQQRMAHQRKYQFSARQIATIANAVGAQKGWDQPTAIKNVVDWLRAHKLLDGQNLDDASIEQQMENE